MPFDPVSVGLAGASAIAGLFGPKPDPNKAYQTMLNKNPLMLSQLTGADASYAGAQNFYQSLLSGDPGVRRSLFASTMYDIDRAAASAGRTMLRNPNAQRGGAMNLSLSNISRDAFAAKAKAVTGKEEEAATGLLNVGQGRTGLFNAQTDAWRGAAQVDLMSKQMGWNQLLQTGQAIGGALFGKGGKGGISWESLFGKGDQSPFGPYKGGYKFPGPTPGSEGYGVML